MLKLRLLTLVALVALIAGLNSCSKSDPNPAPAEQGLSQDLKARINALGFSSDEAYESDGGYIVEGDIFLSKEDLFSPAPEIQSLIVGNAEQYRTTLLVTGMPRTVRVWINSGSGGNQLPPSYGQALDVALGRYTAENLTLKFLRVGTSGEGEIDITKGNGNYLASAGFPTSAGNPYNSIKVNSNAIGNGSSNAFYDYVGSILAHEIGHCIGMRHTDYMDRSYSCGGAYSNEGASSVGAILIPGTPAGPDANSWMLACISNLQNRPFNSNDKTALSYLY
ncbi:MAG: M57 family metalloprotease [Saprospiraceae bacterium]